MMTKFGDCLKKKKPTKYLVKVYFGAYCETSMLKSFSVEERRMLGADWESFGSRLGECWEQTNREATQKIWNKLDTP